MMVMVVVEINAALLILLLPNLNRTSKKTTKIGDKIMIKSV